MYLVPVIRAGTAYFALVFASGFILGAIRTIFLVPAFGALGAVVIELPFMLIISWYASKMVLRRLMPGRNTASAFVMGAIAFSLLMTAELILDRMMNGTAFAAHFASYGQPHALAGLFGQILFALFPIVQVNAARQF